MREKRVSDLKARVKTTEGKLDDLLAALAKLEDPEGRPFSISTIIPNTDSTVSDIRARYAVIAGLIEKFENKGAFNVPLAFFNAAANSLRSIENSTQTIETEITNIKNSQGLQKIDYANFTAFCVNGNQLDLSAPFKTLFDNFEEFLTAFHTLFQAVNPSRAAFNFASASNALSKTISAANEAVAKSSATLKLASERLSAFEQKHAEISTILEGASTGATSIAEQAGRSAEAVTQVEQNREAVKGILDEATSLKSTVGEYQAGFDEFQKRLDARNQQFRSGKEALDDLVTAFTDQKEFIAAIIEQSDNMLSSATVAGLSSEFKSIKDDLTTQLEKAYSTFGWSIAFLFLSAIPLIVFIFAPFIAPFLTEDQNVIFAIAATGTVQSGWQYVGQVIARFIILLPAIWFVTFATSRYNSLFKLREHYAYKYSMAMAVDGFKKQAPGHEELIAALVFEQLAFNPADKLGRRNVDEDQSPNPAMAILLKLLRKKVDQDIE